MILLVLVCNAIIYSLGLALVTLEGLLWWKLGEQKLFWHMLVSISVWAWYFLVSLLTSLESMLPQLFTDDLFRASFLVFETLTNSLPIPATITLILFARSGLSQKPPRWLQIFTIISILGISSFYLYFVINYWPAQDKPKPYLLLSMLVVPCVVNLVWAWKNNTRGDLRRILRLLSILLVVILSLEIAIRFIPPNFLSFLPISHYIISSGLEFLGYMVVTRLYLRFIWRTRKTTVFDRNDSKENEQIPQLKLSNREQEVTICICKGLTNQEIADELFISLSTVKSHIHNILEKTGEKNRAALITLFYKGLDFRDKANN